MELPETDHEPELSGIPKDLIMLIFGPPKVGKTTFAAAWPKAVVIECEPGGAKYVKGRILTVNGIDDLREAWKLLKANPDYCETIVIDSVDQIARWIERDICDEIGLASILDTKKHEKHGSQWGMYSERILDMLNSWRLPGKRVVYLAHTKKAEVDKDSLIINPKTINLYGQTAGLVLSIMENIGHMFAREDETGKVIRLLSFAPGIAVEAGARHPALSDRVITIRKDDPYGAFAALFEPTKPQKVPALPKETVNGLKTKHEPAGAGRKE